MMMVVVVMVMESSPLMLGEKMFWEGGRADVA